MFRKYISIKVTVFLKKNLFVSGLKILTVSVSGERDWKKEKERKKRERERERERYCLYIYMYIIK